MPLAPRRCFPNFGGVTWFSDRTSFAIAVLLYGVSMIYSFLLWRRGFRRDDYVLYGLLLVGAAFHTVAMFKRGFSLERCPINNLYEATTFVEWTIVAAYLSIGWIPRLRFIGAFASPLLFAVGVFALMPALDTRSTRPEFTHGWESLHAALTLLAYGGFGLSALVALMYLMQERNLKLHKARALAAIMPPIQRLERVTSGLVTSGFACLTAGLVTGAIWLKMERGYFLSGDPKIVWSLAVWGFYLALMVGHRWFAQGGRRFAWAAVGSFAFVMLTFWSFNLLSGIHQN